MQESSGFVGTFAFALIIVFLALAAQFESFRDPLIILVSVPMSIAGAMIFIMLGIGGASLNIYTEVGLVTLMGLVSKHGILIVEFANDLQHAGKTKREAIIEAARDPAAADPDDDGGDGARRRAADHRDAAPAPHRASTWASSSRPASIGTLFTLFVVPAFYLMLAADHSGKAVTADEPARANFDKPAVA